MTSNGPASPEPAKLLSLTTPRSVVPGRIRWDVPDVRRRPTRAAMVAQRLAHTPGVHEATANPVTGRVLVAFDPAKLAMTLLEHVLAEALLAPLLYTATVKRDDHHHAHGQGQLGGFVFRLVAGGLALGGILFWLPPGIPPGLAFALGAGMTIVTCYALFRGALR